MTTTTPIQIILHGDALTLLRTLPAASVHCVITSPPYFNLRDYGTATWEGGDLTCAHRLGRETNRATAKNASNSASSISYGQTCAKCGAHRIDDQIGLEPTPEEYVAKLVAVFREVWRVLRDDGIVALNLGDSYASGKGTCFNPGGGPKSYIQEKERFPLDRGSVKTLRQSGVKPKDLYGIPWRVAFALQADGWYLRSEVIWVKKAPMPESVTDRPTRSHEQVFLLTKRARYFWDAEAVKEPAQVWSGQVNGFERTGLVSEHVLPGQSAAVHRSNCNGKNAFRGQGAHLDGKNDPAIREGRDMTDIGRGPTRNMRDVLTLGPSSYSGTHFATYPAKLVEPFILAGTSAAGCCSECGAPWVRKTKKTFEPQPDVKTSSKLAKRSNKGLDASNGWGDTPRGSNHTTTTGWRPTCDHDAEPIPCTVLDPFCGSGTTLAVAKMHGRSGIGLDLNSDYIELAWQRIAAVQPPLGMVIP